MAISQGVGPHAAWLNVAGGSFLIETGSVTEDAKRKTSTFHGEIPIDFPGAAAALAAIGNADATITVMTRGQTAVLATGQLDDTRFNFIRQRTIRFTGRDKSAPLHDNKSAEKWINKKPSDVVQDLIGRIGLSGNVTASAVMAGKKLHQDYVKLSNNTSYAYIIHKMAELDGCRWWVDQNGVFNYVPFGSPSGVYSITIDQSEPITADCLDLSVTRNIHAGKTIETTVRSWHARKKQVFQNTATVPGTGGTLKYSYDIPQLLQPDVAKRAHSKAMEHARNELTAVALVVGDPSVHAGMGLQLNGTIYFDQVYDIDTVHHEFGMRGHTTHITARSPKQGRSAGGATSANTTPDIAAQVT